MVCEEKRAKNSKRKSAARMGKNWHGAPVERAAGSVTATASGESVELRVESQWASGLRDEG